MFRVWFLPALLLLSSSLHAGVYNLDEHHPAVATDKVRSLVLSVRSAALPDPKSGLRPEHFKYQILHETARLEAKKQDGVMTTLDQVALSACYLRLGSRVADALRLLATADKEHFLVQSNLAAAYFLSGEPMMAVRHQEQALKLWPVVFFAWDDNQLRRYRACELALLRLYRSRADESRQRSSRDNLDIDPIFPGVHYVGPSGKFEAGKLSQEMMDRLPGNAIDVLTQLVVWFPTDMRLYWQLGQLLGVSGAIEPATRISEELVEAGMGRSFKDLPQQRRVLLDAIKSYKVLFEPTTPAPRGQLAGALLFLPRPAFAPPIIGDAAYAAGCAATVPAMIEASTPPIPPLPFAEGPTGNNSAGNAAVFNFGHVTIGFGLGFLVAALCVLQWQELRRRMQQSSTRQESTPIPP